MMLKIDGLGPTMKRRLARWLVVAATPLTIAVCFPAFAVDGVIEINQVTAAAGGVTGGDTAGFPVDISESGSYRLTGNLDVTGEASPANVTAIDIDADNVSLDLNGFSIIGPGTAGTGDGIQIGGSLINVAVRNGHVTGFGSDGIDANCTNCSFHNLRVSENGAMGIRQVGDSGVSVTACSARSNGDSGISIAVGTIANSTATGNGKRGFAIDQGSTITGCVARANSEHGIYVNQESYIRDNVCDDNVMAGIHAAGGANRIDGNLVTGNDIGIEVVGVSTTNFIIRNTAFLNSGGNYVIAPLNPHGPIVDVVNDGDITGTTNADHPWANFEQ